MVGGTILSKSNMATILFTCFSVNLQTYLGLLGSLLSSYQAHVRYLLSMLFVNALDFLLPSNFNLIAVTDSQSLQLPPVLYFRKLMKLRAIKHINQFEHMVMHFWGDGS